MPGHLSSCIDQIFLLNRIHENAEGPIRKYIAWFILDESYIDHIHILKQLLMESMMNKSF